MNTYSKLKMILFVSLVSLLFLSFGLSAQTTGKIIGNVSDANTKDALIGANVIIEGSYMGAATDVNGDYYIINIPPGTYNIKVQMMGYQLYLIKDAVVSVNRSTTVNAQLSQAVLEGEEVVVTADKISIKKDQTSSIKNVSSAQIAALPVQNVEQVIEMQAGVVGGHFRGGRLNEVSYLIDGMQVDESFQGERSTVELEKEVVQDLEVITGTFNAEYGKAMSGIVNMVTKDGSNRFHGSAFAYLGNYLTGNKNIFIGLKPSEINRIQDFKFQLEGPIWKNRLSFIANVRYVNDLGHLNGIRRFDIDNYSNLAEPDLIGSQESPWDTEIKGSRYYSEHTGDGAYVPMVDNTSLSYFGKLTFKPFQTVKMALLYSGNEKESAGGYQHGYKYNPDGMARAHNEAEMLSLQLNQLISPKIFYDLKFSKNNNWYGYYLYKDPFDSRYISPMFGGGAGGFSSGGDNKTHIEQLSTQYIGKFDLTWQVNKNHSLKSGVQATKYRVENKPIFVRDQKWRTPEALNQYDPEAQRMVYLPWEAEIYPMESISMDQYVKEPYDYSLYLQDKMEYDALVVNFGLRYDYFNSNSVYPSNRQNPANQGEYDDPTFMATYPQAEPQEQWSPRLGLSYTLGTSAVLHFSYGHFFQMPPFYALYTNHRFMVPNNNFGTEHGNAELEAQKTVKYEMGLWQELMPGLGMEVSVYYSDIYDLLTADVWTTYNQIQYAVYDNKDYANTKGLEVKFDWVFGPLTTNLNYTLQYTRGNADNPRSTYNRLAQNQDPVPKLIALSWDQRHTMNLSIGYSKGLYAFTATGYYNSGFPYTLEPILESRLAKQSLLPNNVTKPSNYRVDLQGHYDIPLAGNTKLRLYAYVKNLFDRLNEDQVYGSTGRAYTSILGNVAEEAFRSNYNTVLDQFRNPGMYSPPREVRFGVGFLF